MGQEMDGQIAFYFKCPIFVRGDPFLHKLVITVKRVGSNDYQQVKLSAFLHN